jgi:hypothetical protein
VSANHDLPILDELGAEFSALIDAELGRAPLPAHEPPPTAQRQRARLPQRPSAARRGRGVRRVARRSTVVLVLLCLVGGVALAARFGGDGGTPAHTTPTTLGTSKAAGWRFSAYRDRRQLCFLFEVAGEMTSNCGAEPGADAARASSLVAGGKRFVVGLAGGTVDAVAVRVGPSHARGRTAAPLDPPAAIAAGVPGTTRWFVVPVDANRRDPARVTALDRAGQQLGQPYLDCSLGAAGEECERAIRARAAFAGK